MRSAFSDSDVVTVTDAAECVHGERALFVIVGDTPGGDFAVPVGTARAAAQAVRHLTEYCPHTRANWQISPQAGPVPVVVVFGRIRPPTGKHLLDQYAHVFLLAAGDPLPPVWTASCGHEISDTRLDVLDAGMGTPCPGCHQRWASAHHHNAGLPVRCPGQHLHPQLRHRP